MASGVLCQDDGAGEELGHVLCAGEGRDGVGVGVYEEDGVLGLCLLEA